MVSGESVSDFVLKYSGPLCGSIAIHVGLGSLRLIGSPAPRKKANTRSEELQFKLLCHFGSGKLNRRLSFPNNR
jgi:hypothetical protein